MADWFQSINRPSKTTIILFISMKTVIFLIVEILKIFKKTRIFLGEQAGPQHNLDC